MRRRGWLGVGYDLIMDMQPRRRRYLIPTGTWIYGPSAADKMTYAEAVAMSYDAMARLLNFEGGKLIPESWESLAEWFGSFGCSEE